MPAKRPVNASIYCVKCRRKQPAVGVQASKDSKGKPRAVGKCSACGTNVSQYVKKGGGFFSDLFGSVPVLNTVAHAVDGLANGAINTGLQALPAVAPMMMAAGLKRRRRKR